MAGIAQSVGTSFVSSTLKVKYYILKNTCLHPGMYSGLGTGPFVIIGAMTDVLPGSTAAEYYAACCIDALFTQRSEDSW
jgi:hypothetical protein